MVWFQMYGCFSISSGIEESLSLIYEKKYEEALDYLNTQGRGCFCNKGVWINDAMKDYISHVL